MRARFAFFSLAETRSQPAKPLTLLVKLHYTQGWFYHTRHAHPGKAGPLRNQEQRAKRELHGSEKKKAASLLSSIETRRVHLLSRLWRSNQ